MTWINFELDLLDGIQGIMGSQWGDVLWPIMTRLGDHGFIWILIPLLLLVHPKTRRVGGACVCALLLNVILTNGLLKPLIARPRPYTYKAFQLLIDTPTDYSFPSGHTSAAFSVAFVLFKEKFELKGQKIYGYSLFLAGMIAFSRLYLYVHFPSDILGGLVIAYFSSVAGLYIVNKFDKKRKRSEQ